LTTKARKAVEAVASEEEAVLEEAVASEEEAVVSEEISAQERCTRQYALIVEQSAKYLSSPLKASLFIARIAS
jgi:hypothetical protein